MTRMRIAAAAALVLALPLGLAACGAQDAQSGSQSSQSSSSQADASSTPEVDRSGEANFPAVTGGFGEDPEISAGKGDAPAQVSVKTLHQGDGAGIAIEDTLLVDYELALWDGSKVESSFESGTPALFSLQQVIPGWTYGLEGQHVGDRVEIVVPAKWGYGDQPSGAIPAGSTLVFVVDVINSSANVSVDESLLSQGSATGAAAPEGISVEGAPGAEPTLSFAEGAAAPEASGAPLTLVEGAGEQVGEGDYVLYRGVGGPFGSNDRVSSSWGMEPQIIQAAQAQLVGQKVGSRLLYVLGSPGGAQSGSTPTVIVLDVVGILTAN